ncbi:type II secretion system protein [bacterium]|nr:type II secretion system protein [bacterium]
MKQKIWNIEKVTMPAEQGKKKPGFTLAETLITIGIIGVVAAVTIPNLMQNYFEKRTVNQLREVQSILAQALRHAEQEYGDVSGWGLNGNNSESALKIAENIKPFLKLANDCGINDTKYTCLSQNYYNLLNGDYSQAYATDNRYYKVSLLNSATIWWRNGGSNALDTRTIITFFVDTNGKNPPNTWGKDTFAFEYYENIGLLPLGSQNSSYPSEQNCNKNNDGYGCAYYVLQNNNMNYLH